ncbi:benzoate/H(+) symporter BenE family transporter [Aliiglaciecola sp. M165]|uniref:benzoate/H(+) symporter BenE family transporter n=1 Tax=Aliiglaciecola sp. M165 TaxID=2593649 RepID=UPI00117E5CD7|nr:benzoate/H(+) symporter BenE family transporter [Aliiglaciecola sp. M165]TRY31282.1 benzoate/H(+) symporter BenE family transporter [Aliiglaciecola sp. M165]
MDQFLKDTSLSAISAGFIAVVVGFASAMAIVFQAAQAAGANTLQIESWVWALGLGMGISTLALSLWYKRPLIIAWSTPGAALLATSLTTTNLAQTTGTFLFVGALIFIVGITGIFSRIGRSIPLPIASAMLAGVLVQFGLGLFTAIEQQASLVLLLISSFLLLKRVVPRYAVPLVLVIGTIFCIWNGTFQSQALSLNLASPEFVMPEFSLSSMLGIGIPLFIVTMTSQNLPGVAILKSCGYTQQRISPLITTTGITTLIFAPFGGFTYNLAAITAAICASKESHPDPDKRYIAGVSVGVFNIIAGLFGTAVVGLFAAFPQALVASIAGLALLSTISSSFHNAFEKPQYREAAMLTFLLTASGISFFGIASAFWGIVLGLLTVMISAKN